MSRIRKTFNAIKKSSFFISAFKVGSGQVIAQFFSLVSVPILSRIYSDVAYGDTPLILHIFYGEKYESCSTIMRVMCLNFMISASFRRLFGNAIAAFKKVKINLLHNVIAGALNIALDLIFIQRMGSMGAALATTIVTVFITILETVYILGFLKKEEINRG